MIRPTLKSIALLAALAACPSVAFASFTIVPGVTQVTLTRGMNPGSLGGIFDVDATGGVGNSVGNDFRTFCAELTQTISLGGTYTVQSLQKTYRSSTAGYGPTVTSQAAYLFTKFWDGSLNSYLSGSPSTVANAIQLGLWRGLGFADPAGWASAYGPTLTTLLTAFPVPANFGTGDVWIMSLLDSSGNYSQDQFVILPPGTDPHGVAPELSNMATACSALAIGACVGAASIFRKRRGNLSLVAT